MGAICPNGHGRQNIVHNLTADGSAPKKSEDVIAWKLACGCVVGGAEYEAFRTASAKIDLERIEAIRKIEEDSLRKKSAAYSGFVVQRGGKNAK